MQSSASSKGGLAVAYIYYLVNYMLISSLQLDTFNLLSSRQLILFTAAPTVLHFNI